MSNIAYIAFDLETGGFDPKVSPILTGCFLAVDESLNVIDELNLKIRPNETYHLVTPEALAVNKINLEAHLADPETLTHAEAKVKLTSFLKKHCAARSKPRSMGHNVGFDAGFVFEQLLTKAEWEKFMHYHSVDTMAVTGFLKDCGWLPKEVGKLESLVKHFNIPKLEHHNARGDILMTVDVYRALRGMVIGAKNGAGQGHEDLLSLLE